MQKDPDDPSQSPVLSYSTPQEPEPRAPSLWRFSVLVFCVVAGFVVYIGALIGMTGNFPLPFRIGCGMVVFAPIVFFILYVFLSMFLSARATYLDIKNTTDRKARRRKIAGLIVTSLVLTIIGGVHILLRAGSDRYLERKAKEDARIEDARRAAMHAASDYLKTPQGQKALFPTTAAAAQTLRELISGKDAPIIQPATLPR